MSSSVLGPKWPGPEWRRTEVDTYLWKILSSLLLFILLSIVRDDQQIDLDRQKPKNRDCKESGSFCGVRKMQGKKRQENAWNGKWKFSYIPIYYVQSKDLLLDRKSMEWGLERKCVLMQLAVNSKRPIREIVSVSCKLMRSRTGENGNSVRAGALRTTHVWWQWHFLCMMFVISVYQHYRTLFGQHSLLAVFVYRDLEILLLSGR